MLTCIYCAVCVCVFVLKYVLRDLATESWPLFYYCNLSVIRMVDISYAYFFLALGTLQSGIHNYPLTLSSLI